MRILTAIPPYSETSTAAQTKGGKRLNRGIMGNRENTAHKNNQPNKLSVPHDLQIRGEIAFSVRAAIMLQPFLCKSSMGALNA